MSKISLKSPKSNGGSQIESQSFSPGSPKSPKSNIINDMIQSALAIFFKKYQIKKNELIDSFLEDSKFANQEQLFELINTVLEGNYNHLLHEANELKNSKNENHELKIELSEKLKETEDLISNFKLKLIDAIDEDHLYKNISKKSPEETIKVLTEINEKNNTIAIMKKKIERIKSDLSNKKSNVENTTEKNSKNKILAKELKNELIFLHSLRKELEIRHAEKSKEIDIATKERDFIPLIIEKNRGKLQDIGLKQDKRILEIERGENDLNTLIEKDENLERKLEEISNIKNSLLKEIESKNQELVQVRSLNKLYEERILIKDDLEKLLREQEYIKKYLTKENDDISKDILEISPRNNISNTSPIPNTEGADPNFTDKYTDMDDYAINKELNSAKRLKELTEMRISELEKKNYYLKEILKKQRNDILERRKMYSEKSETLHFIKSESEGLFVKHDIIDSDTKNLEMQIEEAEILFKENRLTSNFDHLK